MNLKEIGVLLILIYVTTTLLIAYKYYVAKGGVFRVSRWLIIRYLLRFILLIAILILCFYSIQTKQSTNNSGQSNPIVLFGISSSSSSITKKSLFDKVKEMPVEGKYSLIMYFNSQKLWKQIIPATNHDSFLNLLEREEAIIEQDQKLPFTEIISSPPLEDQYLQYFKKRNQWEVYTTNSKDSVFFSSSILNGWFSSSYVKIYLVILIVTLLFIETVFSAKAVKI